MIFHRLMRRGFTLLELLVVISIIALLTSTILASTSVAHRKADDTRRYDDIHEVKLALENYYSSHAAYPSTGGQWWGTCSDYGSHPLTGATGWVPGLAPSDIGVLPTDPSPLSTGGCYIYRSDGIDYKLLAHQTMEYYCYTNANFPTSHSYYDSVRSSTECTAGISTSGAEAW